MNKILIVLAAALLTSSCQGDKTPAASSDSIAPTTVSPAAGAYTPALGKSGVIPVTTEHFVLLNPSISDWTSTAVAAPCAVDLLNGAKPTEARLEVSRSAPLAVVGWILNPEREAPHDFAIILASENDTYAVRGMSGGERPDVSRVFKSEAASKSGFKAKVLLENVTVGEYTLLLAQETGDVVSRCDTQRRITVTP